MIGAWFVSPRREYTVGYRGWATRYSILQLYENDTEMT